MYFVVFYNFLHKTLCLVFILIWKMSVHLIFSLTFHSCLTYLTRKILFWSLNYIDLYPRSVWYAGITEVVCSLHALPLGNSSADSFKDLLLPASASSILYTSIYVYTSIHKYTHQSYTPSSIEGGFWVSKSTEKAGLPCGMSQLRKCAKSGSRDRHHFCWRSPGARLAGIAG